MSQIVPHLGIMVEYTQTNATPFNEKGYFKHLSLHAEQKGIQVTVFSPRYINWNTHTVDGYRFKQHNWQQNKYPIPLFIYDRIFYSGLQHIKQLRPILIRLHSEAKCILLGKGLPGKWHVYQMLRKNKLLRPFIPQTQLFNNQTEWEPLLNRHQAIFLKPVAGSQGRGVLKVKCHGDEINVQGRDRDNHIFSKKFSDFLSCLDWIKQHIGSRTYVVQPYLELNTKEHFPFDLRILIQKDEKGIWRESGQAIRIGNAHGLTSNLHGGGTARSVPDFLQQHYSEQQIKKLQDNIALISRHIPIDLEKQHGPMLELGIDLGIDRQGRVWLLEVNSKPGRKSFLLSADNNALQNAISAPVKYCRFVAERMKEGIVSVHSNHWISQKKTTYSAQNILMPGIDFPASAEQNRYPLWAGKNDGPCRST